MILKFGKYKGHDISTIDDEYLEWLITNNKKTLDECQAELTRRQSVREASLSWAERIIRAGYRSLSSQFHPDHGGNTEAMQEINATRERLEDMLKRSNLR